jgi:hypothetical protein
VLLGELLRVPETRARIQKLAARRWVLSGALLFPTIVSPLLGFYFEGTYMITISKTLDIICVALVLTEAVSQPGGSWPIYRRPLHSLYIWNNLFLNGETGWIINTFPLNMMCVIGMGLFSYYVIERPFLKLKDYFHKPPEDRSIDPRKKSPLTA